ncbi:MAG: hypothetical protein SH868_18075 [Bythopirellula sp.]|nr:hypothetical protein [Bythopirellula sp.]
MGRQIAVAATHVDELSLLAFLRSTAEVCLAESLAPTADGLWVETFGEYASAHQQYWLWNTAFRWQPTFGRVNADVPGIGGWYYIQAHSAPLVEFVRTDWATKCYGRLYWSKDFAAPNGLEYDVRAFSVWFDRLIRWVRKNSKPLKSGKCSTYFLPHAWSKVNPI